MSGDLRFRIEAAFAARRGPAFALRVAGSFPAGQVSGYSGPSGSGKTALLRALAGLSKPDGGEIACGGLPWFSSADQIFVPPWKRSAVLVFQDHALFPHLSARANVRYGAPSDEAAEEALEIAGMADYGSRGAGELSGGQKQRIALARALAARPGVLLMDEPFSSLDEATRHRLRDELGELLAKLGLTAVLVSHLREDLERLCSRVTAVEEAEALFDRGSVGEQAEADHARRPEAPRRVEIQGPGVG